MIFNLKNVARNSGPLVCCWLPQMKVWVKLQSYLLKLFRQIEEKRCTSIMKLVRFERFIVQIALIFNILSNFQIYF